MNSKPLIWIVGIQCQAEAEAKFNTWYDDELVRTDKGWRISSRVCRLISWTGNPLVPEPAYEQRPVMTTHTLRSHREAGKVRFFEAIARKSGRSK